MAKYIYMQRLPRSRRGVIEVDDAETLKQVAGLLQAKKITFSINGPYEDKSGMQKWFLDFPQKKIPTIRKIFGRKRGRNPKTTVASVNKELKKRGYKERLTRGNGYYYFYNGEAEGFYSSSVPVYSISDMSVDDVIWFLEKMKEEYHKYDVDGLEATEGTAGYTDSKNPKFSSSNGTMKKGEKLYESFHENPPTKVTRVYFEPPKGPLVKIGDLSEIKYRPTGSSKHVGVEFYHKSGDTGDKVRKTNLILCTDQEGKHIYLVKKDPDDPYPQFTDRGIIG